MTRWTSTHPEAVTPYIPGGTYAHTVTRFLNATQQNICAVVRDEATAGDTCVQYVNCVFEQLSEYDKAGLGVGTTLLTLIPMALSAMPASKLDVYAIWMLPNTSTVKRLILLVLAAFSGFLSAGQALRALRDIVDHEEQHDDTPTDSNVGRDLDEVYGRAEPPRLDYVWDKWNALYRFKPGSRQSQASWLHWVYLFFSCIFCLLIIYSSITIGYLGVVTWSCDRQPISLSWTLARAAPPIFEACILAGIHFWLRRRLRRPGQSRMTARPTDVELRPTTETRGDKATLIATSVSSMPIPRRLADVLRGTEIFCRALEASLVLYGTAALGSTVLVDGIPAMIFLLLIPGLYGAMQLCLHEIVRGIHLSVDKTE